MEVEKRAIGKVIRRLLPFLIVCYFVAYLDRVNVGFAKLHMNQALGLSSAAFGLGAGLFFIGYFLFEVPSNLLLDRFARPDRNSVGSVQKGGRAAITPATGIAAINSIGNLGGFFGPTIIGLAREWSGSFTLGLMVSAVTLFLSTAFVLSLRRGAPAAAAAVTRS